MKHYLKISDDYHNRVVRGEKRAELRFNDRDFQRGDVIVFMTQVEKDEVRCGSSEYISKDGFDWLVHSDVWEITHVLHYPHGLKKDYVVLSIDRCHPMPNRKTKEIQKLLEDDYDFSADEDVVCDLASDIYSILHLNNN